MVDINKIKKNPFPLLLILILLFGFILRIYSLSQPMWIDETISSLASLKILEKGLPIFDSGIFYSRALLFHYSQAFFFLFQVSDITARLPSLIFGLLTIVLAYFIGKEYNKTAGIVSALFTSIFLLEIVYSTQARFYQLFQLLFFLTIFLLYKADKNKKYSWLSLISLIVLINTHLAGLILLPFFFYFYRKDYKLLIIPSLLLIYYGFSILSVFSSQGSSGIENAQDFSFKIFSNLRAFLLISILGMYFAFKKNKILTLTILLPSIILFISLFFQPVFASRYLYFLVLPIIIFFSLVLTKIKEHSPLLFILVLLFSLLYPSDLFFSSPLTILKPHQINYFSSSEPSLDFSLQASTIDLARNSTLVCLFTPSCAWYIKSPDYFIPFSLNSLSSGYFVKDNKDIYTNAEVFDNQADPFILIEDDFGYNKLNEAEKADYNKIKEGCTQIDKTPSIRVYSC